MAMALYHPERGFFSSGGLRSARSGDFLTSPEVSPLFGETVGRYVASVWDRLGRPPDFAVCDAGAGSGSLLAPLLASLDFPCAAYAVEVSPAAREALTERIPQVTLLTSPDELRVPFVGVIVANELLDNLPMALAVREPAGWSERWVTVDRDELSFIAVPARTEVVDWLNRHAGPVPEGGIVEVQLEATAWVTDVLARLARGSLVIFDYGDTAGGLAHRRADGTLRTYRGQHLGPHPLAEPGATDITADVNFTAIAEAARQAGTLVRLARQAELLEEWGLAAERDRLRAAELELARTGDPFERLIVRTRHTEAATLLHPRGLGDFMALVADR